MKSLDVSGHLWQQDVEFHTLEFLPDERGKIQTRDYKKLDEEAAYAVGAAALVPYCGLRRFVLNGKSSLEIARHFRVSRELVEYRLKVTRLWKDYRSRA